MNIRIWRGVCPDVEGLVSGLIEVSVRMWRGGCLDMEGSKFTLKYFNFSIFSYNKYLG